MRFFEQSLNEQIRQGMPTLRDSRMPRGDTIGLTVVITVTYFLVARMGLTLLKPEGVAVMWPALGLAVGGLIALGSSARVPVAVGICTGIIASRLAAGGNAWLAIALGLCNTGGALLTAGLIERWFGPAFRLENVASVLGFLGATVIGTVTAAVVGSAFIAFAQPTADFLNVWHGWFTSAALGIITVAPLPIGLASAMREAPPRREQIEGAVALVVLGLMSAFAISLPPGPWATAVPVAIVFPLVLWIAVRCRPVFAAAAAFIVALAVVCSTSFGLGHFGQASISLADRTLAAQTIVLAGALCVIILSALFAERREKEMALRNSNQRLQMVLAEREEAERVLADRNAQLALSGKIALVGSYAYNANETSMQISSGYAAIHGLPEGTAEEPRHAWHTRVHPDDIARLDAERRETFRERRHERILEYRIIRSGGEVRWIESRSFVSYESDGRQQRVVGVNIDVTQRKRAERVLKESEARLRDALAAGQVMAFDWDASAGLSQRSENASQILGIEPKRDANGASKTFLAQVHPDDRLRFKGHIYGVHRDNPSYSATFRFIRPDGQQVWLEEVGSGEFDAAGRLSRIKGLTRDISERKKVELVLAERQAQLELANNIAQVGSYTYNYATRTLWLGPGSASIYGLHVNSAEMTAEEWRQCVHPDDLAQLVASSRQALANRQCELVCVFRILRNGEVRWIETRNRYFYDKAGRATQTIGVSIDVTERRRAEDHKGLLLAELDHRVKNALACVAAIAQHARESSNTMDEFLDGFNGRIQSLANTHALLSRTCWQGVSLAALIRCELASCMKDDNTDIQGPDVDLVAEATQPIAMVLHELTTNAGKYGALSNSHGRVSVCWEWRSNGGSTSGLAFEWRETGGPPVVTPRTLGYGSTVIRDLIPYELGGIVDYVLAPDGVRCKLEIPAKWLSPPHPALN